MYEQEKGSKLIPLVSYSFSLCLSSLRVILLFFADCSKDFTVVFLLDRAKDVGRDNVMRQVEYIISVASTISFNNIGVISYATDPAEVITPGQASNFSEFAQTLREANYPLGHMKNLGKALTKSQDIAALFNRTKPALIVTMISGKSHDDSALPAEELKKKGVTIIALVFGTSYSQAQLSLIVSRPTNDHMLRTEFAALKHYVGVTRNAICKGNLLLFRCFYGWCL